MYNKNQAHYLVVTGIIVKDNKYLIAKRASWEKAFPNKWTVPGGKVEILDYVLKKKDTKDHWYNILENILKKECMEEVALKIHSINYITSMVYIRSDNIPTMIISLYAKTDQNQNEVILNKALTEYKWVTLEEAKKYDLIEGIYEEIEMLNNELKEGKMNSWQKKKENL